MFCLVTYKLNMYNKNEELIKKVDKANGNVSGVLLYAKSYSEDIDSNFMNNKTRKFMKKENEYERRKCVGNCWRKRQN